MLTDVSLTAISWICNKCPNVMAINKIDIPSHIMNGALRIACPSCGAIECFRDAKTSPYKFLGANPKPDELAHSKQHLLLENFIDVHISGNKTLTHQVSFDASHVSQIKQSLAKA